MTTEQRVTAIMAHGFTQRQAAFVVTVLLHSGVCVPRQYCAFAGISRGQVSRDFFAKLSKGKVATTYAGGANGAPLFHVHRKSLYRAIGEPNSRLRRRGTVTRAIERLMVLDGVLARRDVQWCATEDEKVEYCVRCGLQKTDLPSLTYTGEGEPTRRYFPDRLPFGVIGDGTETAFLFVATERSGRAFRAFLERHESLLRRLPRWRILLALPRLIAESDASHRQVFSNMTAAPLRPAIVDEFRWFCGVRRAHEEESRPIAAGDSLRYARARRAFGAPRFNGVYRRWCTGDDGAFHRLMTPAFHDASRRGTAVLETLVLPYVYGEVGPLIRTA